jgi:hypothetical protein
VIFVYQIGPESFNNLHVGYTFFLHYVRMNVFGVKIIKNVVFPSLPKFVSLQKRLKVFKVEKFRTVATFPLKRGFVLSPSHFLDSFSVSPFSN